MRILIVGGGIAGTASALALHQAGFEVCVYEAHPRGAEDLGAFLALASSGMRALAQVDAAAPVAAVGFPLTTMRVLAGSGATIAEVPLGEPAHPLTRYRCLRRGGLNHALQSEARRRGIAVVHGARLASLTEGPDDITATFTDGTSACGDLLIGADGINSAVRALTGLGTAAPRYAGQRVFYGYSSGVVHDYESTRITMIRGAAAAFGYATSPAGETYWFARVPGPPVLAGEIAHAAPEYWRDHLVPLLRQDATPAAELVAASGQLMVTNACDLPPGLPWRAPRTLLIGDAAHAASPATGQSASMALVDAVVLAKALRDRPDTDSALAVYEQLRRPRVEYNTAVSARVTVSEPPQAAGLGYASGPGEESDGRPVSRADPELLRQLDWDIPFEVA
jgi:2-polyprenyl-6-methoxyphenol hydroxylase-like FAD-dependent oxidoreductase